MTAETGNAQAEAREQRLAENRKFLEAIQQLYATSRGQIATLKRNGDVTLGETRGMAWFHYYLLRHFPGKNERDGNICLLVASMMTFDRGTMLRGLRPNSSGDFGASLASLRSPEDANARPAQTPLERRLIGLLDSTFDDEGSGEMAFRLRQSVKFALSKEAPIDWPLLLEDMRSWGHPSKFVQKRWARSFYAVPRMGQAVLTEDDPFAEP